jgi:hypothetical protein
MEQCIWSSKQPSVLLDTRQNLVWRRECKIGWTPCNLKLDFWYLPVHISNFLLMKNGTVGAFPTIFVSKKVNNFPFYLHHKRV